MISLRLKHDIRQALDRHTHSLWGRVRGLATRFVLGKATRAAYDLVRVRGETFSGDASDADELIQNYGFASVPLPGAEGVRIAVFADGDHGVIVALDDRRYRPTFGEVGSELEEGESAQYHRNGAYVRCKNNGDVVVFPSGRDALVHLGEDPGDSYVARVGDEVAAATGVGGMATWMAQVAGYINGLAPGTVNPPAPTSFGIITTGAAKVKAS